jgi:hypothetical protein
MCWNGTASTVVASLGFASAAFAWKKGESKMLWMPIAYFSGMEALQAFTYTVMDECQKPENQIATILAYVHICFQPFFVNAFSLYFVPKDFRERWQRLIYGITAVFCFLFLLRALPIPWLQYCYDILYSIPFCKDCALKVPACGTKYCAVSGNWHIAWEMPLKFHVALDNAYLIGTVLLPLLYGSWRVTIYLTLAGPILAAFTTNNMNEWPAVWCLFSTSIIGIALIPAIRDRMRVTKWPLFRFT